MKYKIISDSASNQVLLEHIPFTSVPIHIIADHQDFIDDPSVDLSKMEDALTTCKSSSTACPSVGEWLTAFEDAENVFCITITSTLSGSYFSAVLAKKEYEKQYPSRKVYVLDSLSAGPEMVLIIEKMQELILSGMEAPAIWDNINTYTQHTGLLFSLQSLDNLAKNGRVNPAIAKLAGLLGIRVVGQASSKGDLEVLSKCRGEQGSLTKIIKYMKKCGYHGGKVRIAHNHNEKTAKKLALQLQNIFDDSDIQVTATQALCSYYAEKGGLMIGFEH